MVFKENCHDSKWAMATWEIKREQWSTGVGFFGDIKGREFLQDWEYMSEVVCAITEVIRPSFHKWVEN